jgi:hypothetical protein
MTSEEKKQEARKAVVCNQPGTNPTMFYYTERCILKEDAHTYKRINRQQLRSRNEQTKSIRV